MNGVIAILKPIGKTSHDMVYFMRKLLCERRVGHTGTLDPDATGVLPICIGVATKASQYIMDSDKTYIATMQLGASTTTQDASGEVVDSAEVQVSEKQLLETFSSFVGEIEQIPPMYSAVKVNGRKLYELAREGLEVERKARKVRILCIRLLEADLKNGIVKFEVDCSKGTYVRTLIHDIGLRLGCFAHMTALERIKSGGFTTGQAYTCEQLLAMKENGALENAILPTDAVFMQYPAFKMDLINTSRVKNGIPIYGMGAACGQHYRVYGADGAFLCLSVGREDGSLKMITSFWSE